MEAKFPFKIQCIFNKKMTDLINYFFGHNIFLDCKQHGKRIFKELSLDAYAHLIIYEATLNDEDISIS